MHERNPDDLLLELEITYYDDGDVELRQGEFDGYDMTVTLHRSQMALLAREKGFIDAEEVGRRVGAIQDRLSLLVGLVRSHCGEGHPLRAAADFLAGDAPEPPTTAPDAPPASPRSGMGDKPFQLEMTA